MGHTHTQMNRCAHTTDTSTGQALLRVKGDRVLFKVQDQMTQAEKDWSLRRRPGLRVLVRHARLCLCVPPSAEAAGLTRACGVLTSLQLDTWPGVCPAGKWTQAGKQTPASRLVSSSRESTRREKHLGQCQGKQSHASTDSYGNGRRVCLHGRRLTQTEGSGVQGGWNTAHAEADRRAQCSY